MRFGALVILTLLPVSADQATDFTSKITPLLEKYCFRCHGAEKQKGDVQLSTFRDVKSIIPERKLWLKVVEQIRSEEMPNKPPLPTKEERLTIVSFVEGLLHNYDWDKLRHPGRVTIPRLTKSEYNNTMRDLLGIGFDAGDELSEDGEGESGFDNDRDALFVTPSLMEKYLAAADRALESLIALEAEPVEYHFESEEMFMTETRERPVKFDEDFFGFVLNRGQMTLYDSVEFPHDGMYEFSVRARSTSGNTGTRLRLDDEVTADIRITESEPATYIRTAFVGKGTRQMAWNILQGARPKAPQNRKKNPNSVGIQPEWGGLVNERSGPNAPVFPEPKNASPQVLALISTLNKTHHGVQRPYEWLRLLGKNGEEAQIVRFKSYIAQRTGAIPKTEKLLSAASGIAVDDLQTTFNRHNAEKLEDRKRILEAVKHVEYDPKKVPVRAGSVAIDWIKIRGPVRPSEQLAERLFAIQSDADPKSEAQRVLSVFMLKAFRRPVTKDELSRYLELFSRAHERGDSMQNALKLALSAVLVSPKFLFRPEQSETDSGDQEYRLNDFELASRLSYFLWLSMPDEELFHLAEQGSLQDSEVVAGQVRRMLKSPKSRAFAEAFSGQWLGYAPLGKSILPDAKRFPEFDEQLATAMREETVLFFDHVMKTDGSLLSLIDSKETFLNARLAAHYDLKHAVGDDMERVSLTDRARGGLLGMASVLTATSSPTRTSPVIRGKWVLETLLGNRLPEPPPDAGELAGDAGQKGKTLREELLQHRRNPSCAACHDKIDPIGFGLENFDALGRFRQTQAGKQIDSSGELPGGVKFTGPVELKDYILTHRKSEFVRNVTERMLSFALGRKLRYYDEPAVRKIIQQVEANEIRASALVRAIALSYPFQHQSNRTEDE